MHCLVNYVKEKLQSELVSQLYKVSVPPPWYVVIVQSLQSDQYEELMQESDEVKERREETSEMLKVLTSVTMMT